MLTNIICNIESLQSILLYIPFYGKQHVTYGAVILNNFMAIEQHINLPIFGLVLAEILRSVSQQRHYQQLPLYNMKIDYFLARNSLSIEMFITRHFLQLGSRTAQKNLWRRGEN